MISEYNECNASYINRVWLAVLFQVVFTCQYVPAQVLRKIESKEITLRIDNLSSNVNWQLTLASSGDTLYSGPLNQFFSIELDKSKAYHANIYLPEGAYAREFFINPLLHDLPVVRFTCYQASAQAHDPLIERYSEAVRHLTRAVWPIVTSSAMLSHAYAEINKQLNIAEATLSDMFYMPFQKAVIRDSVIEPVRWYINSVQTRYEAESDSARVEAETSTNGRREVLESRKGARSLRMTSLSNEAYMMVRSIAYASAYQMPKWMRSKDGTLDRRLSLDVAKKVLSIAGESCACEVGYGLYQRSSVVPGFHFERCTEELPRYLMSLAETDSSYFCSRLRIDLQSLCDALSTKVIDSFEGTRYDSVIITREINPDSMYMLHFWGTWCKPCIDSYDLVEATADTIESMGFRTIHIACENSARFPIWKRFSQNRSGEQLFTHKSQGSIKRLADQLAISSFPTILILGKGGEIIARDIEIENVVDFVRRVAKRY